jgi:hypothetical protein
MRDIFEALRKHPWLAGVTATAVLSAVIHFFLDKLILDGLRDLIFAALGRWLGISDVNALVTLLSYAIPIGLAGAIIWGVYRLALYNAGIGFGSADTKTGRPSLSPPQQRLLELIAKYQREFTASKLIVGRKNGQLHFDRAPDRGKGINLIRELYGATGAVEANKFEALVESMPPEYLRLLPENRYGSPFVISITEAGSRLAGN